MDELRSGPAAVDDEAIRGRMLAKLLKDHSQELGTVFIEELGLCCGAARVDVAVATPAALHGYEIKGETDTLKRLPGQIEVYSAVLDRATLVVHEAHLKHAEPMLPGWWGLIIVRRDGRLVPRRKGRANPKIDPRCLVESLWRPEAYEILESRQLHKGLMRKPKHDLFDVIAVNIPLDELRFEVRTRIRTRPVWGDGRRTCIGPEPWARDLPPVPQLEDPWVLEGRG
jgi:hypothetical protein